MTLDEAIKHAEEVADLCEDSASKYDMSDDFECHMACQDGKCAEEHRQLAEWLRELKAYKDQDGDTIDRQAAIRIANGYCHPANIAAELSKLSSAQPERKTDVLNKIRAEIDGLLNDEDSHMYTYGVMDCLEIIDKYRAESEETGSDGEH